MDKRTAAASPLLRKTGPCFLAAALVAALQVRASARKAPDAKPDNEPVLSSTRKLMRTLSDDWTPGNDPQASLSRDGGVAAFAEGTEVRVFDVPSEKLLARIPVSFVDAAVLSDDGKVVATSKSGVLEIWRVSDGKRIQKIYAKPKSERVLDHVAVSSDGSQVAYAGYPAGAWNLTVCSTEKGDCRKVLAGEAKTAPDALSAFAFSTDWKTVAAVVGDKVSIYKVADGSLAAKMSGDAAADILDFSPDGSLLGGGVLAYVLAHSRRTAPQDRFYSFGLDAYVKAYPNVAWETPWTAVADRSDADLYILPFMTQNADVFAGKRVLDIGTGTGIIALKAAKLGARKVIATDISPLAVENTRENAGSLGLDAVIETRLVSKQSQGAFSFVAPDEVFDVVTTNLNGEFTGPNLGAAHAGPSLELLLSIVSGLQRHLAPGGSALFRVPSRFGHDYVVHYARSLGFDVQDMPGLEMPQGEWCYFYNTLATEIAKNSNLNPTGLLMTPEECLERTSRVTPQNAPSCVYDPNARTRTLWGKPVEANDSGLIAIRRPALQGSGAAGPR